ncbi:hypothetical protein KJW59_17390, partial [Enterococcus faecium]|nr:hypothetical protein [Enterococcus faecium]
NLFDQSINQSKITKNLSQNEVHSDPDLILYNPSVLIDKEPFFVGTNMTTTKKPGEHMIVRLVFNY